MQIDLILPDVSDSYRQLTGKKRLAEGTTAIVDRALLGGTAVAVKEFLASPEDPGDSWVRAQEEIVILRRLKTRMVPKFIFGGLLTGGEKSRIVLATKLYKARTLADVIARPRFDGAAYGLALARAIGGFTLRAIALLGTRGVIHRDIKPENILVLDEERFSFRLIDFGLARRLDRAASLPSSWRTGGASRFRSPQKWGNFRDSDETDDIWSVGVIMFRILNGRYPFESRGSVSSEARLGEAVLHEPPTHSGLMTRDAAEMNKVVAWLIRKERRMRAPLGSAIRSLAESGGRSAGRRPLPAPTPVHGLVRFGRNVALDLSKWRDRTADLKVALICGRAIAIDSWPLDSPGLPDFFERCVRWLQAEKFRSGQFPSKTLGHGTTYCTASALIALSRIRNRPDLPAPLRESIATTIVEAEAALDAGKRDQGWPWFVSHGAPHPIATHWAALALAEVGKPAPLRQLLAATLTPFSEASAPPPRVRHAEISFSLYCAARLAELDQTTIAIDRSAAIVSRFFFECALRGQIDLVDSVRVDLPDVVKNHLGGLEFLDCIHPTAAMISYALFSYSAVNPFLLDAGLKLSENQRDHCRTRGASTFEQIWASVALSRLQSLLGARPGPAA